MKTLSLFTGAGGLDIGLERAGAKIIVANEMDATACKTYQANHPFTTVFNEDIIKIKQDLLHLSNVDLVAGGPPCQGFSVAGKMNPDDPRSQMVFHFADIVCGIKPRFFIMENVSSLGRLEKFESVRQRLFTQYKENGYHLSTLILNAHDFGLAQSRERFFIVGSRYIPEISSALPLLIQEYQKKAPKVKDVLLSVGQYGTPENNRICKAIITLAKNPVLRKSAYSGMLFNGQGRPINLEHRANTLPASMGGNRTPIVDNDALYLGKVSKVEKLHSSLMSGTPIHKLSVPSSLRRLTVDEALVLQDFPRDYCFSGSQSKIYNQIGNAVPSRLGYILLNAIKKLDNIELKR
mgnify:CR=1 FL=1